MQELKPTQENLRLLLGQAPAADLTALKTAIILERGGIQKGHQLTGFIPTIMQTDHIHPFTLPTPPPGMKWHREDGWTAEMLPPGKRPFFLGETSVKSNHDNPTDQVGGGKWAWGTLAKGEIATVDCKHLRTARPLLFIHSGHEWTWHRAGDPCPCAERRIVQVLLNNGSPNRDPAMPEFWDWEGESPDGVKIIGWRYADACAGMADPAKEITAMRKAIMEAYELIKPICLETLKHWDATKPLPDTRTVEEAALAALAKLKPFST